MVIGLLLMITHDINAYVACISVVVCCKLYSCSVFNLYV